MTTQPYPKAPIVEAVIEIRFGSQHDEKELAKLQQRFLKLYPHSDQLIDLSFLLENAAGQASSKVITESDGYKLTTTEGPDLLLLKRAAFSVSRLAPYVGWDMFIERFERDWEIWNKIVDRKRVTRIGLRHINRIDVPCKKDERFKIEDYLNLNVRLPSDGNFINQYTLQVQMPVRDHDGWQITLNSGMVPPVLLDHAALLLDIDLAVNTPPQKDAEIFDVLAEMRKIKNEMFESAITDSARKLFRNG